MELFIQSADQPNSIHKIVIVIGPFGFGESGHITAGSTVGRRKCGFTDWWGILLDDRWGYRGRRRGREREHRGNRKRLVLLDIWFLALHIQVLDRVLMPQDRREEWWATGQSVDINEGF